MSGHTRRTLMAMGASALSAACATVPTTMPKTTYDQTRTKVVIDESRIARIDVGLRPYREIGFRVEAEALDEKLLVHNYGHGGGGVSLSWGTAQMAVDLGFRPNVSEYVVLGAGVVGLSTAILLLDRGAEVRIITRDPVNQTTSNVAGAQWWPASVFSRSKIADGYLDRHVEASRLAHLKFQSLVGPNYGIRWEPNYIFANRPISGQPAGVRDPMRQFAINQYDLAPGEHPFGSQYVRRFDTMMIETPHYLRRLERDFREKGGRFDFADLKGRGDIAQLSEDVIFNCTGLGAGKLVGDNIIQPVRGQLVVLRPQDEIDYNVITPGAFYMFGRRDGIILGGTFQKDNWSLEPSTRDTARIIAGHKKLFA